MSGIEDFWKLHLASLDAYTSDGYEPCRLFRGGIGRVCTDADMYLKELHNRGLDVYFSKIESDSWNDVAKTPIGTLVVHFITKVYTAVGLEECAKPPADFSKFNWQGPGNIFFAHVLHVVPKGTL